MPSGPFMLETAVIDEHRPRACPARLQGDRWESARQPIRANREERKFRLLYASSISSTETGDSCSSWLVRPPEGVTSRHTWGWQPAYSTGTLFIDKLINPPVCVLINYPGCQGLMKKGGNNHPQVMVRCRKVNPN